MALKSFGISIFCEKTVKTCLKSYLYFQSFEERSKRCYVPTLKSCTQELHKRALLQMPTK